MNTLDFEALQRFTRQAQKLQDVAREIIPFIEAINALDGKDFIPLDRLIRAGEAAQMLGVNTSTISEFVKTGLLTPLYVNSDQRRFWLSQVKALPQEKSLELKASGMHGRKCRGRREIAW